MRQQTGVDLWTVPADARCITTNAMWRSDGCAVMGRGCAKEATQRYPGIARVLGLHLKAVGNHVGILIYTDDLEGGSTLPLLCFPVKHHWEKPADPLLIERSAHELLVLTRKHGWETVVLPRPGCGNGGLRWEAVEPILKPILDDRFLVVTR